MIQRKPQPRRLKRGKALHLRLQADWERSAGGRITRELSVTKPSGRRGRIDIHAEAEEPLVAVVEIKATDWNRMTTRAVRCNVARHARQVWDYIESQLAATKQVSPGLIYPSIPRSAARRDLIEALLDQQGIAVVWDNESVRARRARGIRSAG
jgi:hypothetical protein